MRVLQPRLVLLSLVATVLTACATGKDQFAPACPIPGLVRPLAEIARYRGQSRDIRDLIVRARVIDITGTCEPGDDKNTIVATPHVVVDATRGPALQGNVVSLPVFIAVTDASAIRDKSNFDLPVTFPDNIDTARAVSKGVRMEIPVTPQKTGAAYGIIGGFQLTPAEVAAWRHDNPGVR